MIGDGHVTTSGRNKPTPRPHKAKPRPQRVIKLSFTGCNVTITQDNRSLFTTKSLFVHLKQLQDREAQQRNEEADWTDL